jgi:hypothetical protein
MAKLRINGDSSGYVDLEAPNAASSSTLDLDQVPQKNVANTFSTINKFADSVSIGGTHSPTYPLDVRSTGQAIVRVDGVGLYFNGIKIRNNYSSVQSDWNVGAAGGSSGWGSANGTFIIRDDTTNSTGLEIEQGAGSNTAALHINSSGYVTKPQQPAFFAHRTSSNYTETTATAKLYINGTRFNHGGHYDTTNHRFVAPVAGEYQFNASANCYSISADNQLRVMLYVNGSVYVIGDSFHSRNANHDLVASVSHVVSLSANDYVEVWTFSDDGSRGFSAGQYWNTFSGYLLG